MNSENEKAAVFCLSEISREKGGGLLRKKPPEKIVFVSKVYYPLWTASFGELNVVFDGLNIWSHSISYQSLPSAEAFMGNLKDSSSNKQIYSTFLSSRQSYFHQTTGEKTLTIDGLLTNLEFVKVFNEYLKEAKSQNQVLDGVLISAALKDQDIPKKLKELEESQEEFKSKLSDLREIMKEINASTQGFLSTLGDELTAIDNKYSGQNQEATAKFEQQKTQLNKTYFDKVTEVSEKLDKQILELNTEVIRLEKTIDDTNLEINHVDGDIKNAQIGKDEDSEQKLKDKKSELKKKIPEFTLQTKELKEKIQLLENDKKAQLFQLQQENDAKIKQASKELRELEAERDAEKLLCQNEMEKIEENTKKIIGDIDQLTKLVEATINGFSSLGVKGEKRQPLLINMPIYLICYTVNTSKRFSYIAPSQVNTMGTAFKLKAIGRKKVTLLLEPRSQEILSILNKFMQLLNQDVAFQHEIAEACEKQNILKSTENRAEIQKGLNALKTDGWISEDEYAFIKRTLEQI